MAPVLSLSGTPAGATVGKGYFFRPQPSGGAPNATLTYSLSAGALPEGLTFSTHSGTIRGSATTAGTTSGLAITVTDGFSLATLSGISLVITAPAAAGSGGATWIADNRGASISEQGVQGGSNASFIGSRPRSLPFDLKRFYVVVPVFLPKALTAPTITDTLFADARTFAFSLAPWQASFANRPAGAAINFGANPSAAYDPATWDANAPLLQGGGVAFVSNLVDLGANFIPANTTFDWRAAVKTAAGLMPYTGTVNGTDQTGHGNVVSASDIVTSGIADSRSFVFV
ncbi:MAG: hypothetical protein EON94_16345, partial [Caulobacteraceae bacterium]